MRLNADRQVGKLWIPAFKVFRYDSTRGMNLRFTDSEARSLTTTLSRRNIVKKEEIGRIKQSLTSSLQINESTNVAGLAILLVIN